MEKISIAKFKREYAERTVKLVGCYRNIRLSDVLNLPANMNQPASKISFTSQYMIRETEKGPSYADLKGTKCYLIEDGFILDRTCKSDYETISYTMVYKFVEG